MNPVSGATDEGIGLCTARELIHRFLKQLAPHLNCSDARTRLWCAWSSYPDDVISEDQARTIAEDTFGPDESDSRGVMVERIEHGYLAWVRGGETAGVPTTTGDSRLIIDGDTGETTSWPPLPTSMLTEQYGRYRSARRRFSPAVFQALSEAGWRPGMSVSATAAEFIDHVSQLSTAAGAPLTPTDSARAALDEFAGIQLALPDGGELAFYSRLGWPRLPDPDLSLVRLVAQETGEAVYPVALLINQDTTLLLTDETGRVIAARPDESSDVLGESIEVTLQALLSPR